MGPYHRGGTFEASLALRRGRLLTPLLVDELWLELRPYPFGTCTAPVTIRVGVQCRSHSSLSRARSQDAT